MKNSSYKIVVITLLILGIILLTLLGCQSNYSSSTSDIDNNLYSYDTPEDALVDIENEPLIEELRDRGFLVYENTDDAINDLTQDELIEAVKDSGFYVYENPIDAFEDLDDGELIDELEYRGYVIQQ